MKGVMTVNALQQSCGKAMFSQAPVSHSVHLGTGIPGPRSLQGVGMSRDGYVKTVGTPLPQLTTSGGQNKYGRQVDCTISIKNFKNTKRVAC